MKLLLINGVNLNMLGIREPNLYGKTGYKNLIKNLKSYAKQKGVKLVAYQSNCEGALCSKIQKALNKFDGIIINPGAYTHTSVAILDALKAVGIKTCEVHITDINDREEFRKFSYISLYAQNVIVGKGVKGYEMAIDYFLQKN